MKIIVLRTKAGGSVQIALPNPELFQGLMKAIKSDGMLLSDTFMCPYDAIDSCMVLEVAEETTDPKIHRFPPRTN